MKYRLFASTENICDEIWRMEKHEKDRREDRATVSNFFHGAPPYSQDQADALGLTVNVNNLFGFEHLTAAKDQLLSLYTTPPRLWEVELQFAPAQMKKKWESEATAEWNRIMKRGGRLKMPYEFVAGDATMHGEGFFWNPNPTDWCPSHCSLARRLVPEGATMDVGELTHFAVVQEMSFRDLHRFYDTQAEGWNRANLKAILEKIFRKSGNKYEYQSDARYAADPLNPELLEYYRQDGPEFDRAWSFRIPVVYFYQVNFDSPNRSLMLTVIAKDGIVGEGRDKKDIKKESVLYECEDCGITMQQTIFPLHMSCVVGGEPLWSRVKGLGHINYSLSWHLEVLMGRCIQAAHEQATTFYQAADAASRSSMEQILVKHNGIIPEGITLIQGRGNSDFNGLLSVIQSIRGQAAANANTIAPNTGTKTDELATQALFRQSMIGAASTNRVVNWFDYMGRVGGHIFSRFTNPLIQPMDKGYSEIMEFQGAMIRLGIPLEVLQPQNVHITPTRVVGDGVPQKALSVSMALMDRIQQFGPEAQQDIKRMFVGATLDDYELAEKLVPYTNQPNGDQLLDAETENNVFAVQGKPMPVRDKDVDSIHIQAHFDFMARLVQKAVQTQNTAFTMDQLEAFKAAGAHTYLHIQKVEPLDKEAAKKMRDDLNNIAAMGQKCANNLAQTQEQEQGKPDPKTEIDMMKLQLAAKEQELKDRKQGFNEEKFAITQEHREAQDANRLVLQHEQAALKKRHTELDMALSDVDTSLRVRQSANPAA